MKQEDIKKLKIALVLVLLFIPLKSLNEVGAVGSSKAFITSLFVGLPVMLAVYWIYGRAEHITALIHLLADIRAQMTPAVAEEPPPVHAEALHDPRYVIELHPFSGGTLLEFRHPSLGWMDFVLPSRERIRISRLLVEQEEVWQRYPR